MTIQLNNWIDNMIFFLSIFFYGVFILLLGETSNVSYVCDPSRLSTCLQDTGSSSYLYVFMLGQAIHGIGFTPMFTLGTAFVDDNAKTESTAVYIGNL